MRNSGRKIGSVAYVSGWNQQYGYGAVDASTVVASAAPGGNIIVEKQTIPDGDPATFTFTGDAAGTIGDGGLLLAATGPGTFTSTETVPGGWKALTPTSHDFGPAVAGGSYSVTFINTRDDHYAYLPVILRNG